MKIVINTCYGGFGLSTAAYEQLIAWGVPVCKYEKDPGDAEVIFDRELTPPGECPLVDIYHKYKHAGHARYWDCWTRGSRTHPLVVRVVETLGIVASDELSRLRVITIPDDVEWAIEEYDGKECIHERHRTWC